MASSRNASFNHQPHNNRLIAGHFCKLVTTFDMNQDNL